ncbi:MAG TPA: prepilin-type cleavage/methylation domain-containing protein [Verrucomicrobiae bacterium]|nr:prepilin-type cleavage/methylation domain-containing protein [Verrucomicrobiae bacterium]
MGESENKSSILDYLGWFIVFIAIGFLTWLFTNNFIRARSTSAVNACINNLRQIDAAKNQWALENSKTNGTIAFVRDITPYIKLDTNGNIPKCPRGGVYTVGKVGDNPTCSLGTTVTPAHVLP